MKLNTSYIASLIGAAGLLMVGAQSLGAADGDSGKTVTISLNAGETYVIKNLGADSTPAVHVIRNPNALVVSSDAPGQLVLLGAGAGEWALDVKQADGQPVTYDVSVNAIAAPNDPLAPGKAPAAISDSSSSGVSATAPAKAVTMAALDTGSGPIEPIPAPAPVAPAAATAADTRTAPSASVPSLSVPATTAPATVASASPAAKPATPPSGAPVEVAAATPPATTMAMASAPVLAPPAPAAPVPAARVPSPPVLLPGGTASTSSLKLAAYMPDAATTIPNQAANALTKLPAQKYHTDPAAVPVSPSENGSTGSNFLPADSVIVQSGSSRIFDFPNRLRRISVADTDVADIQVINPYQIQVIGHKEGFTTLAVWDTQGRYQERQLRIDPFGRQQVMLNVIVAELNRGKLEQNGLNWSVALRKANLSLANNLAGGGSTQWGSTAAITANGPQGSSSGAFMPFGGELMPLILSNSMTYGISSASGDVFNQEFFEFLEAHNLGKVLSEPRLLANSGEKAEFLDGGEIPIVITQALNSSVVFKQFGTSVIFVPTVVGKDEIELEVKPEVSQPDFGQGVNLFGFTIPSFVTRRAQTLVRLRNNQTLIIAGLLLRTPTSTVNKVPYLGDLPWIGNMFKNTYYNNQESDLMMSVTPQIVEPLPGNAQLAQPTDHGPMSQPEIQTERLPVPDASRPRF